MRAVQKSASSNTKKKTKQPPSRQGRGSKTTPRLPAAKKGTRPAVRKTATGRTAGTKKNPSKKAKTVPAKIKASDSNPKGTARNRGTPSAKSTSAELNAKVDAVTESNTQLHDEIRAISKMIIKNQKGMTTIGGMAESLQAVLMQIQKQSRQISGLKKETQGLFEGLEEIGAQADSMGKIAVQMRAVKKKLEDISEEQKRDAESDKSASTSEKIDESIKTIRENSEAIAGLVQTMDSVRRETKKVAARSASAASTGAELDSIRSEIAKITDVTQKGSIIGMLRGEIEKITRRVDEVAESDGSRRQDITGVLKEITSGASQIENMRNDIDAFKNQMDSVASNADFMHKKIPDNLLEKFDHIEAQVNSLAQKTSDASSVRDSVKALQGNVGALKSEISQDIEKITAQISQASDASRIQDASTISEIRKEMNSIHAKIQGIKEAAEATAAEGPHSGISAVPDSLLEKFGHIEAQVGSLAQKTSDMASVKDSVGSLQEKIGTLKSEISQDIEKITTQISQVSDASKMQDTGIITEIRREIGEIHQKIQGVRTAAGSTAASSSQDTEKLLRLSAFQSSIRMISESKYGDMDAIRHMSVQTAEIARFFEDQTDGTPDADTTSTKLPLEVKQWAISKILDCGDRWEIRFADIYSAIKETMGMEMIKDALQIQQVRDIYGIRSVKMIKEEIE